MLYQINMQAETLVHVKASFQIKFRIESSQVKSYKRMFRGGSIEVEQGHMAVTGQHVVLEEKVKRIYMARLYSRAVKEDQCQVFFLCQLSLKHL